MCEAIVAPTQPERDTKHDVDHTHNDIVGEQPPVAIGLLLADDFPMLSYAAVVEPLRAANLLSARELYVWRTYAPTSAPVTASNGASLIADHKVGDPRRLDILLTVLGGNPATFEDRDSLAWLRQLARRGVVLGGVSGGPYALARAGLLQGHQCTIHWEHLAAFREEFPRLDVSPSLYVMDRRRLTCAGGVAALDMVLDLIEQHHGTELAAKVGAWFIRTHVRSGGEAQREGLHRRYGTVNPRVLAALGAMEGGLEENHPHHTLAQAAGVTVRQLERLFKRELGVSVGSIYLGMRLERARSLLRQSPASLIEVALSCGFASVGSFSRAYKARFAITPSRDRSPGAAGGERPGTPRGRRQVGA